MRPFGEDAATASSGLRADLALVQQVFKRVGGHSLAPFSLPDALSQNPKDHADRPSVNGSDIAILRACGGWRFGPQKGHHVGKGG
jgi:hypothetical protein